MPETAHAEDGRLKQSPETGMHAAIMAHVALKNEEIARLALAD